MTNEEMDELKNPQFLFIPPSAGGKMTRKEKLGFISLMVLAILIIYLGFRQMGNAIKGPFASRMAASLAQPKEEELNEAEQMAVLKQKDTDKDGLSDYDELYLYQTSPYLADTDSDGLSDQQEIIKGTNPNCPVGKECAGALITPAAQSENATSTGEQPFASSIAPLPSSDQMLLQSIFGANPDPQALRDFLLKQGLDKKTLDTFNDTELLNTFKDVINSTSTASSPEVNPLNLNLDKLSAKDLRQLLIQQGVSEEMLKKISDEELMEMVKEMK